MSTFSSVVNKSGKKLAPKATARRNVSKKSSSITPNSSEIRPSNFPVLPLIQNTVNSSDVSQVQSSAEQDVASTALRAHTSRSAAISTPVDAVSPGPDSATDTSQMADDPRLGGQTRKDATREGWAGLPENAHNNRVAKRQSKAQPARINNDQIGRQQSSLTEEIHEHGINSEEQAPSLEPHTRAIRSRNGSFKRKSDARAGDSLDMAPSYSAATDVLEEDAFADNPAPRKRQRVAPKGHQPVSVTDVRQNATEISGEERTYTSATVSTTATQSDIASLSSKVKRKSRTRKTMQEVAAEIVADTAGDASEANEEHAEATKKRKPTRKRKTPLGAEDYEIVPSEVKMADLIKDKRLGKGSTLEARLQAVDWDEVKKKRKEAAQEAEKQQELEREERKTGRPSRRDDVPAAPTVPKLTIRDNQIVMEEESRMVDRHAEIDPTGDEVVKVQDINDVTRRVNQSTIGRQPGVKRKGHWNDEMTDLFYKGLRMFGTDFMMISKMFPGMSRRHIKLKYTREERTNLARVTKNLITKEDVDMEEYSQMSNQVYEDPEIVKGDIRAEEQRLRDEDVARRARETEVEQDEVEAEDNVLQSREQGAAESVGGDGRETTAVETESSAKENRFTSVARSVVQRAAAPKKTKKQSALARKRDRKQKTGLEGTEEVVGSIEEVHRE